MQERLLGKNKGIKHTKREDGKENKTREKKMTEVELKYRIEQP